VPAGGHLVCPRRRSRQSANVIHLQALRIRPAGRNHETHKTHERSFAFSVTFRVFHDAALQQVVSPALFMKIRSEAAQTGVALGAKCKYVNF
jgi:hypothetical protein